VYPVLSQHFAHIYTASREDAGEDACFQRLPFYARQSRQQGGRSNKVSSIPLAGGAALLDYVQLIANLEGKVVNGGGLEGVYTDAESDAGERSPGHSAIEDATRCNS